MCVDDGCIACALVLKSLHRACFKSHGAFFRMAKKVYCEATVAHLGER